MLGFYLIVFFKMINFIGVHCGVDMVRAISDSGEVHIVDKTLGEALKEFALKKFVQVILIF